MALNAEAAEERQILMEELEDDVESILQMEREKKDEIARVMAPISRAGYMVAAIVALLLYWFLTTIVFDGNRFARGVVLAATALFFLSMLMKMLEKRGAKGMADTIGTSIANI